MTSKILDIRIATRKLNYAKIPAIFSILPTYLFEITMTIPPSGLLKAIVKTSLANCEHEIFTEPLGINLEKCPMA